MGKKPKQPAGSSSTLNLNTYRITRRDGGIRCRDCKKKHAEVWAGGAPEHYICGDCMATAIRRENPPAIKRKKRLFPATELFAN